MLPCICWVVNHRWCQNVVGTADCVTDVLPHFYILCDLLQYRLTGHGLYLLLIMLLSTSLSSNRSQVRTNQNAGAIQCIIQTSTYTLNITLFLSVSMTEGRSGLRELKTLSNCNTCWGVAGGWLLMSSSTWTEKTGFWGMQLIGTDARCFWET